MLWGIFFFFFLHQSRFRLGTEASLLLQKLSVSVSAMNQAVSAAAIVLFFLTCGFFFVITTVTAWTLPSFLREYCVLMMEIFRFRALCRSSSPALPECNIHLCRWHRCIIYSSWPRNLRPWPNVTLNIVFRDSQRQNSKWALNFYYVRGQVKLPVCSDFVQLCPNEPREGIHRCLHFYIHHN